MIRYTKGSSPRELTKLQATPNKTWDDLGAVDRGPIRVALVRDQGGLCAYCQCRISPDEHVQTGLSQMKIEHRIPRSISPAHQFVWSNMVGVCLGISKDPAEPGSPTVIHCDTARGNRALFLHPVHEQGPNPRDHLKYTNDGHVQPVAADPRVHGDITVLNLNAKPLVRSRSKVFELAWKHLTQKRFAIGELRRLEQRNRIVSGTTALEHAEFLRYHLRRKIRSLGHEPAP